MNGEQDGDDDSKWFFTTFFDDVQKKFAARTKQRTADAIARTLAPEERLAELSDQVSCARETRQFLASDFWADRLKPWLRSEAVLKPATPNAESSLLDRINVTYLIGSGKVLLMEAMLKKFQEWIDLGEQAEKILALEAEKKKRLRETAA